MSSLAEMAKILPSVSRPHKLILYPKLFRFCYTLHRRSAHMHNMRKKKHL